MVTSYGNHRKLIHSLCSKRIIRNLEYSSSNAQGLRVVGRWSGRGFQQVLEFRADGQQLQGFVQLPDLGQDLASCQGPDWDQPLIRQGLHG